MQHGLRLTNLSAVTETGVTRGDLWIDGGRFANGGNGDWPAIDCNGRIAFPGMIDLLQHGMFRHLYSDATPGAVAETSDFLLSTGTTGFLPSIGCQTPDRLMPVLAQLARDCDTATGARALGIHSEGPCFAFPGAHNPQNVQPPSVDLARAMIDAADGRLVSVTLAPELPGAQGFATTLRDSGVALHLGHSDAPPDDVPRYLDWGVRAVTHVFNVMPPKPYDGMGLHPFSLPEALLAEPGLALGLICDGIHVHPRLVQLLAQLPLNRVFLETDAMKFAGAEDTSFEFYPGYRVHSVRGNAVHDDRGGLCGSSLTPDEAMRNYLRFGADLVRAGHAAALVPARVLGLDRDLGSIAPGKRADFCLLDPATLAVTATWIDGAERWRA